MAFELPHLVDNDALVVYFRSFVDQVDKRLTAVENAAGVEMADVVAKLREEFTPALTTLHDTIMEKVEDHAATATERHDQLDVRVQELETAPVEDVPSDDPVQAPEAPIDVMKTQKIGDTKPVAPKGKKADDHAPEDDQV
jgi:hypothetical protein